MSTARERVRAEAEERAEQHSCTCDGCKMQEYIAGRTVTAEQIEQAARFQHDENDGTMGRPWEEQREHIKDQYRQEMRALFTETGFTLEEEAS